MGEFLGLAAPPGRDVGDEQLLAAQRFANLGNEGEERPRLQDADAERVDHGDAAPADRLDQAGRADLRPLVELQRIGPRRVQPPPEHADRPQSLDGADHQGAVDHRQVLALQQKEAQVSGDIGLLVVGLIEWTGGENGDAALVVGAQSLQRIEEGAEEASKPMDVGLPVKVRKDAAGGDAIFEREGSAGGCLRAVAQHPPAAIRAAADFEGQEMQEMARARLYPNQRPQPLRIGGDQRSRQMSVADQAVVAVNVGHDRFQKIGALDHPRREVLPLVLGDHHRHMAEGPVALGHHTLAVLTVVDAGVAQILIAAGETRRDLLGRHPRQVVGQPRPYRAHDAGPVHQLIRNVGERTIAGSKARRDWLGGFADGHRGSQTPIGLRRSRVMGNSPCGVSGCS